MVGSAPVIDHRGSRSWNILRMRARLMIENAGQESDGSVGYHSQASRTRVESQTSIWTDAPRESQGNIARKNRD